MSGTRRTETGSGRLRFEKRTEKAVEVACEHTPVDDVSCFIQAQGIVLGENRWIDLHEATSEVISSIYKKLAHFQNTTILNVLEKSY